LGALTDVVEKLLLFAVDSVHRAALACVSCLVSNPLTQGESQ
jgi:hypothetical protein